jgi:hypothetical protein
MHNTQQEQRQQAKREFLQIWWMAGGGLLLDTRRLNNRSEIVRKPKPSPSPFLLSLCIALHQKPHPESSLGPQPLCAVLAFKFARPWDAREHLLFAYVRDAQSQPVVLLPPSCFHPHLRIKAMRPKRAYLRCSSFCRCACV